MALIVWDRRLETGHGKIDEQHKSLVETVNRLHEAMKQGKGRGELEGILVFLKDYTVTHFAMEEELMDRHAYAGAPKHKQIHADLVRQVADLVTKFQAGKAMLTLDVMNFLEDWLTQHIQGEDYRLALDLKGKGVH
jgi:hemerythrin-like metal-binding protein